MQLGFIAHMPGMPLAMIVIKPHENAVKKWTFKGMDGMKHVAAFLTKSEPQVIQAHEASSEVIMKNCIRCHTQLNTEFVKTGKID